MKKYIAEFLGTCFLVLFGCGSAVGINTLLSYEGTSIPLAFSTLTIAFAFGLSIVAMAYSIGNISGCHVNPAVSLAMFLSGKLSVKDFIGYVVAQFIGGIAGAAILAFLFGSTESLGANGFESYSALNATLAQAFVLEVILTFLFVFTIIGVTSKVEFSSISGLIIGLALTLVHILGIPFTGTSVNPARSFGPALLTGSDALIQVWVFILAPLIGGALAAFAYNMLRQKKTAAPKKRALKEEVISEDAE
ncbi:MAG: MIP family channel protein [Clostridia bacterium]|nr:MIP family channel protein [Clostridia bacterium]